MPIQDEDLKLLKSAVMADVPEGGGAMTGIAIADGVSNNIFDDVSNDDRAGGDASIRKVFGIAHTDNTDTLLGASFVVLSPPADPLVHVALFETDGWADERTDARERVESAQVKGARLLSRIQGTHYTDATILQLYNIAPATGFPVAGDTVVLRNPDGAEQYTRIIKTTLSTAEAVITVGDQRTLNLCVCELADALAFDVLGADIQVAQPSALTSASVYGTTPAGGVRFYGVKPLAVAAAIGDKFVMASGGIYTPLVPASTTDEPVVDIYPLVQRPSLSRTAQAALTLPAASLALGPGTVLRMPVAVVPASLTMTHGATVFTTNAAGELLQGTTVVGTVDHRERTVTMLPTAPSYGTNTNTIIITPATVTGATAYSRLYAVNEANMGSVVEAFDPPPAPGTLSIAYMAQGRWYELVDDGSGKLVGADSSHGTGTVNYTTGSAAASLGASADEGSGIIYTWGDADSARSATGMPTRAETLITLADQPVPGTVSIAWSRGATNYTATVSATGVVTGPAQVTPVERQSDGTYTFGFSPDTLPDGNIAVTYTAVAEALGFTNDGSGAYTLADAPIKPGSLRFKLTATRADGGAALLLACFSSGTEVYARHGSTNHLIGSVNNTTGVVSLTGVSTLIFTSTATEKIAVGWNFTFEPKLPVYRTKTTVTSITYTLQRATIIQFAYQPDDAGTADSVDVAPVWRINTQPPAGLGVVTNGAAFNWAGDLHHSRDGVVFRGWSTSNGAATSVGAIGSDGVITLGSTPPAGASNAITWSNLANDVSGGLDVFYGAFRVPTAPIKASPFQLQAGARIGSSNTGGEISGDFTGLVDAERGIVEWIVTGMDAGVGEGTPVRADELTYNAIYLQYVPIDADLLGLNTSRLPLDGRVPIYRAGGQVLVHNTLPTALPNPLTKGTAYSLGRERIAAVTVRTAAGVRVPSSLYELDRDAGEITVPVESDITGLDQPFTVHHRIEDELMVQRVDISGRIDLVGNGLTHAYPADTSFVSSKLRKGDLFARAHNYFEQVTWTGVWSDERIGDDPTATFNSIDYPITVTNRGAITERWAFIRTGTTQGRLVGENVGQVLTDVSTTGVIEAINPQTGAMYLSIDPLAWGGGWPIGGVLRFNTAAAGAPAWAVRTVLPGPATVASDAATLAFRADVDA